MIHYRVPAYTRIVIHLYILYYTTSEQKNKAENHAFSRFLMKIIQLAGFTAYFVTYIHEKGDIEYLSGAEIRGIPLSRTQGALLFL